MNEPAKPSRQGLPISVVLCTYNGSAFLRQQLDSIAAQTRLPDEVIVRDDRSSDDTLRIVDQWAAQVPFHVCAQINAENLGSSRNFAQGIAEAQGEIIVLSDQDDVWLPQKLEKITAFFEEHPAIEAVFTDGWVVDESLHRLERLSANRGFRGAVVQRDIARGRMVAALSERAMATGATMALRAELRTAILPLPNPLPKSIIHDGWIALVAALRGTLGFLDEPLVLYRQHAGQQVGVTAANRPPGASRWRRGADRARTLDDNATAATLLRQILHTRFPEFTANLRPFDEQHFHLVARRDLPVSRLARLWPVLREWFGGRYHRFGQGTRTALADLLN